MSPETIGYIEAHGTGTKVGDPIEIAGLVQAFRSYTDLRQFCAVGSVKSNIGHLDAASGVASFIKTVLMLNRRLLVPSLHYQQPNSEIDFVNSPFYVNTTLTEWKAGPYPRRAGISSFGMGGTNAHVILEEAPETEPRKADVERPFHLLTLSAKTEKALQELAGRYEQHLGTLPGQSLADVCFSANVGRSHFEHRLAVVARSPNQMQAQLRKFVQGEQTGSVLRGKARATEQTRVVFLFTGQGSQYAGMGRELYHTQPAFRNVIDICSELLSPYLDQPLLSVLYPGIGMESPLNETRYTQPALFALEYALAELWRTWGIEPAAVMGHSIGEYVAACVAGVFSLEDGLALIAQRARLINEMPRDGGMAAVFADENRVREAVSQHLADVDIAAVNGPSNVVISGLRSKVHAVVEDLGKHGISAHPLDVSHAFHSPLMEPVLEAFERVAGRMQFKSARIPLISNATGRFFAQDETPEATYWSRHVRRTVRFAAGMETLREHGYDLFLELGPSPILLGMGRQCFPEGEGTWLPSLRRGIGDWQQILETLGNLYVSGAVVDWDGFDREYTRRRVPQPTYPFQRKRYWIEGPAGGVQSTRRETCDKEHHTHPLLGRRLFSPLIEDIVYENLVSTVALPYLAEHRVFEKAILPATAYIDMLAAAAHRLFDGEAWKLVELVISDPLVFHENEEHALQLILHATTEIAYSFRFMGGPSQQIGEPSFSWRLHASGTLGRAAAELDNQVETRFEPKQLLDRNQEEVPVSAFYQSLSEMGLSYGNTFRGMKHLWRGQNEAVALIQAPEGVEMHESAYHFHPAMLDACLQSVLAASSDNPAAPLKKALFLPMVLSQARIQPTVAHQLWCHARLLPGHDQSKETVRAGITVWDSNGQHVARIDEIRLKQVRTQSIDSRRGPFRDDWLYEIQWFPKARKDPAELMLGAEYLPSPEKIGRLLTGTVDGLRRRFGLDSYQRLQPEFDALCAAYVVKGLNEMGFVFEPGRQCAFDAIANSLGVLKQHRRMLRRMLQILEEDGLVVENNGIWEVVRHPPNSDIQSMLSSLMERYPTFRVELQMTARCGECLAVVLRGKIDPKELLFPGGSLEDLENLYRNAPFTSAYNLLVQKAVTKAFESLPAGRTMKILEIGAGTGGTASAVLPCLAPAASEYLFTDVSSLFMVRARQKFKEYPFVTYRLLDIGSDPEAQQFTPGHFDLILATNVLHATPDLTQTLSRVRRLLKPGALLVMVEGIARQRWVDLIFGLTEGWWLFADKDLRGDYPLIDPIKWHTVLEKAGFDDTTTLAGQDCESHSLFNQAVFVARAAPTVAPAAIRPEVTNTPAPRKWLVLANQVSIGSRLKHLFRSRGDSCDLIVSNNRDDVEEKGLYRFDPGRPELIGRLLREATAGESGPYDGAIYLCSAAGAHDSNATVAQLKAEIESRGSGLLHLVQALTANTSGAPPRLWVVTSGAQPVADLAEPTTVSEATLWGMSKVIALEHPELRCKCVDLDPEAGHELIDSLLEEILVDDEESHIGFRGNSRFVARLIPVKGAQGISGENGATTSERPYRLKIVKRGTIDNLRFVPSARKKPGTGEIEIRVRASGLNLKDVLNTLGAYPGEAGPLGLECAGEIVRLGKHVADLKVGDEVITLAPGVFGSYVTVSEQMAVRKPMHLSFEEAATLPAAYTTAYYALHTLARIKSGDRVLIHSAAGGFGMAALHLAKRCGATIFATAGNPEKRDFVRSLGADYVMDSRTLEFAGEIKKVTSGNGVDIVVNSLAGDFIAASLSVLKRDGRFCELGKQGIQTPEAFSRERPEGSYYIIDVGETLAADPQLGRQMLSQILQWVEDGSLQPLPVCRFPIANAKEAFRYMAQAKHIGKVVLTDHDRLVGSHLETPLESLANQDEAALRFKSSASYLLTGGRGGLGLLLARWMVEHGARHLVLVGRSKPSHEAQAVIRDLEKTGVQVYAPELDVSSFIALADLFKQIETSMPPLRGVIHAAGVLDDGVLTQLTWNRFESIFRPKVYGAWNLHQLSRDMDLDFFFMFSSIASVLGSPGQANHAAANAFMDSLAHYRRAMSLPATAINWGAWGRIGAAAKEEVLKRLRAQGIDTISPEQGLEVFKRLLTEAMESSSGGIGQIAFLHVDWSKYLRQFAIRQPPSLLAHIAVAGKKNDATHQSTYQEPDIRDLLENTGPAGKRDLMNGYIAELISKGLGMAHDQRIDPRRPLNEYGLDSLMAVDLRNRISTGLRLKEPLPVTMFFDYPTLEALSGFIAKEVLDLPDVGIGKETKIDERRARRLAEIEELTEDEAAALLMKELSYKS